MAIPRITIQSSALDVISDVESKKIAHDSFWVSWDDISNDIEVYQINGESLVLRSTGAIEIKKHGNRQLSATYEHTTSAVIEFPSKKFPNYQSSQPLSHIPSAITTIDVASRGDLLLVGTSRGELTVLSAQDRGTVIRKLKGHLMHTTKAKFFPSGQAAVSIGSDFQIKIWNIVDGSNPRTLTGHKGHITDIGIIERGRNIVSSSKDATVKLWEVGSAKEISSFDAGSAVNALAILGGPSIFEDVAALKFGVDNKTIAIGLETESIVSSWDLRTSAEAFKLSVPAPTTSIASHQENTLVTGHSTGEVCSWDVRNPSSALSCVNLSSSTSSASAITSLSVSSDSVVFSTEGETDVYKLNLSTTNNFDLSSASTTYLAGGSDPVTSIVQNASTVFMAGKNSSIWAY
ncbi:Rpn14p [Sugiyamaella lignohabitans]|uniref:Rpn14p n=1 Tax=Sugiyamaella lignohabitans TaxID=796027 RepID=A0A167FI90_9ASCO|nr:Rpn14p [Sugiyamaella lignohabitans]ANB15332.1 Rpn14p [Sugiyamaella lignohabitans]